MAKLKQGIWSGYHYTMAYSCRKIAQIFNDHNLNADGTAGINNIRRMVDPDEQHSVQFSAASNPVTYGGTEGV